MAFSNDTFLSDIVIFIRNDLDNNITDPIEASRVGRERFVMTSYPKRETNYPIITVRGELGSSQRLGMQSEGIWMPVDLEVRIWATNEKQKDQLTQEVFERFRKNQFGTNSSTEFELHDFFMISSIPVDEDGEEGIKSRVMTYQFKIILI